MKPKATRNGPLAEDLPPVPIGPPDDAFEREADAMAGTALRTPGPAIQRKCDACEREEEEEEELTIRRKGTGSAEPDAGILTPQSLTQGGDPLSPSVRSYFEPRFGQDFTSVRTHSGRSSDRANRDLSSAAFTYGNHIWLGAGQTATINPLLAHELAHVTQQTAGLHAGIRRYFIQRSCLPTAACPVVSADIGGGGFNWEAAEICLQMQYPYGGVVGSNKTWKFLTAPPGTAPGRDLDCFKSHLMAKSGMFLAQPDIIDFTRAEIYDVTTHGQARAHAVRLWADVEEATALAAIPDCSGSGRAWSPGTWQPSPCYLIGPDLFIEVENVNGLLLYRVLRDVSKELALAALLAAAAAAAKSQLGKKAAATAAARVPYVALAYAAVVIVVLLTTDAELSWAAEGDPVTNLVKAIENSGTELPPEIKEAMKSNSALREKIEATAKANLEKNPSERAKKLSQECLKIIADNKDKFSLEELEALLTVVEVTADNKLPDKAPTVEALKKQAEAIREGTAKDPGAAGGGTKPAEVAPTPGRGGKEKTAPGDGQGLKPETTQKIANAPETVRRLLTALTGQTAPGQPMTDADVERFLAMVPGNLNASDLEAILAELKSGQQAPKDVLDNLSQVLARLHSDKQTAAADEVGKKNPKLSQESREKLAANPLAAQLLQNVAASGKKGIELTDANVDRFLAAVSKAKSVEQIDAVAATLKDVREGQPIDEVLTSLEKAIAKATKSGEQGAQGGGGQGAGQGPGKASGGEKGVGSSIAEQLAKKLALLQGKVGPGQSRVEYDGKKPVTGTRKTGCRFFGKTADGTAYISLVTAQFTKVDGLAATYKIMAATKLYDLNAQELVPDKPLVGRSFDITLDPETTEAK